MKKKLLSILVPCYNEAESLPLFYTKFLEIAPKIDADIELIFIDDGSKDSTLSIAKSFRMADKRIRYLSFSRNFGKEAAIYAGLQHSKGDYVVLLDADLQHPPDYIPEMFRLLETKEFDSVAMYRSTRKGESRIRSFFSKIFYRVINKISSTNFVDGSTDYRMMTRQVVDTVLTLLEYNRFTKGIFSWVGFNTHWIPYENVERSVGNSKWSFWGLLNYSFEAMIAFSTAPLAISSILGLLFCILAFISGAIVAIKTLIWGDPVAGFPTLFCMLLLIGGIILLVIGIQGQYLSRMYLETKRRPIYILKESEQENSEDTL